MKSGGADQILGLLNKSYPDATIALSYSNAWELLVAVILSAQCTDVAVNKCTARLFAKYKTLDDYIKANPAEFEKEVSSITFYKNKAKFILHNATVMKDKFAGRVPDTMENLLSLQGVARKTANVILNTVYDKPEGIVVDTHVLRLSQRLHLVDSGKIGGKNLISFTKSSKTVPDFKKDADPAKVEAELMSIVPKSEWKNVSFRLINHGRAICKAVGPDCPNCPLNKLCPASRV